MVETKKIAVYGSYEVKVRVKQRYWKLRKDGICQRYWKKTKRTKTVVQSGRYEFQGKGKELYKAVIKAHKFMPKGFVQVSAEKFLGNPERYGLDGGWVEREVES